MTTSFQFKLFEVKRDFWLCPRVSLKKGQLVKFNGTTVTIKNPGCEVEENEEAKDLSSLDYAVRRKWLVLYKEPTTKLAYKAFKWCKNVISK